MPLRVSTILARTFCPNSPATPPIYAYNFQTNCIPGEPGNSIPCWRDVSTIDAYYEANMDLRSVKEPILGPRFALIYRVVRAFSANKPD
jgi:ADP-glucose pyrophosphorylase